MFCVSTSNSASCSKVNSYRYLPICFANTLVEFFFSFTRCSKICGTPICCDASKYPWQPLATGSTESRDQIWQLVVLFHSLTQDKVYFEQQSYVEFNRTTFRVAFCILPHFCSVPYRGGFGVFKPPPPKFRRYRWSPRSHKQEEPASRFPFEVHCVLIRL